MKAIHKYPLNVFADNKTVIMMGPNAHVLQIHEQAGQPHLWAIVDPDEPATVKRTFMIYGTGWTFDDKGQWYLGTAFCTGLVWHVFEVKE